ncbi:glycoprotein Xg isoform X3 [Canis lupus dingo]|uniref:glycoprotein Xg isoform X3 n=1 Tax=Canis lupus dingo TaxID=286419 RepID=UPI0020C4793D|nr:glycoprotein Xg isoform X3 [Canis lupus dingo]
METCQRDFDLADALDDPEPTKKPSSDLYPKPRPPYQPQPQPGMPDHGGGIYPRPRPPPPPRPRPQPGISDGGGGYFGNTDPHDGRYPPRPKPPAGGGGGYYPGNDGYGGTHEIQLTHKIVFVLRVQHDSVTDHRSKSRECPSATQSYKFYFFFASIDAHSYKFYFFCIHWRTVVANPIFCIHWRT